MSSAASPDSLSLLQRLSGEMMALGRRQTLEVVLWDEGGEEGGGGTLGRRLITLLLPGTEPPSLEASAGPV